MEVQGLMADDTGSVLYLVISGAPAPEGLPALVVLLQAGGWQVVVFSTPFWCAVR